MGGRIIIRSGLSRYHWLVIGLAIIVILLVGNEMIDGLDGLRPVPEGVGFTRPDSEKIKLGMTEKEVVEALGVPPGNYATVRW